MTYRPLGRWGGVLLMLAFAAFAAIVIVIVIVVMAGVGDGGVPAWFIALWLAAFVWNVYWWLFRTCVEVRVDGSTLGWSTPLRRGQVPVADVVRIRPTLFGRQMAAMEMQGHRSLLVPVRVGFGHLERAIAAGAPHVLVDES